MEADADHMPKMGAIAQAFNMRGVLVPNMGAKLPIPAFSAHLEQKMGRSGASKIEKRRWRGPLFHGFAQAWQGAAREIRKDTVKALGIKRPRAHFNNATIGA